MQVMDWLLQLRDALTTELREVQITSTHLDRNNRKERVDQESGPHAKSGNKVQGAGRLMDRPGMSSPRDDRTEQPNHND